MPKLKFLSQEKEFDVVPGCELSQVFLCHPGIPLKFGCKQGECGMCVFEVADGAEHLSRKADPEARTLRKKEFGENCRLACQCALVNGDVTIR